VFSLEKRLESYVVLEKRFPKKLMNFLKQANYRSWKRYALL
jgi:hypothetical protein